MEHFIEECEITKDWFKGIGKNKDEILEKVWSEELGDSKGRAIIKAIMERKRESNK